MKKLLNVGGNSKVIPLPSQYAGWEHHLLDIDPAGNPDIVCDARELSKLEADVYDAIYCSHNLEHYYRHDAIKVLRGFLHVTKQDGFAHIRVPDMDELMRRVVAQSLDIDDVLYQSSLGPISVLDVVYGYGEQIERSGCEFFAHKTGFTKKSLAKVLLQCGFAHIYIGTSDLEVVAYAFKQPPSDSTARLLKLETMSTTDTRQAAAGPNVLSLSLAQLVSRAEELSKQARLNDVVALYREWLAAVKSPLAYAAQFNLGRTLSDVGDLPGSLVAYQAALAQNPVFFQARLNLGTVLERLGRQDEAISEWQKVLDGLESNEEADRDLLLHALNNLGRLLEVKHRYTEAEAMLVRSLAVRPDQEDVLHHLIHLRQKQCEWPIYPPLPGISADDLLRATSALAMLSASDDPVLQLEAAEKYVRSKVRSDAPRLAPAMGYKHKKLRIGYLSSNFGLHAVSILTAELYELHDRKRVEVFGFSLGAEDNTPLGVRVRDAMDHFVRLEPMTDEESARTIREAEIDVLIDLQGLTLGYRPNILACRPATIQIAYLGFPGTTGMKCIDYVLADKYVIPEESARFFTEKPLYMPDCFQVNDRKRVIGPVSRRDRYELPDDAFVFCAFNHNHKFTPELFSVWMRILDRTPGSVLWLLADNDSAKSSLMRHAEQQGIDGKRLVFAPRVPPDEYLARFRLADLFLDTIPFNGGTTASDVLWAGLPVLTCSGRSFASRMAGSLLLAIGLPELVTTTLHDYEEKAVALASDRASLGDLRNRLTANRDTYPLFDTPRFTRALEDLLVEVAAPSRAT